MNRCMCILTIRGNLPSPTSVEFRSFEKKLNDSIRQIDGGQYDGFQFKFDPENGVCYKIDPYTAAIFSDSCRFRFFASKQEDLLIINELDFEVYPGEFFTNIGYFEFLDSAIAILTTISKVSINNNISSQIVDICKSKTNQEYVYGLFKPKDEFYYAERMKYEDDMVQYIDQIEYEMSLSEEELKRFLSVNSIDEFNIIY